MAYFSLEDTTGSVEVLVFPKNYLRFASLLENERVIYLEGRLVNNEEECKIFAENLELLQIETPPTQIVELTLTAEQKKYLVNIRALLDEFSGDTPLELIFPEYKKKLQLRRDAWVNPSPAFFDQLESILGPGCAQLLGDNGKSNHKPLVTGEHNL